MTAVATPPTIQSDISRNGWSNGQTQFNLNAMTPEEVSRTFVPRKGVQRSNSSSSISSTGSSTTTISTAPSSTNGVQSGDLAIGPRKKPTRGIWPSSKAEPVSGLSTARSQSVASVGSSGSAASAISALHTPSLQNGGVLGVLPQQQQQHPSPNGQAQPRMNGVGRAQSQPDTPAVLYLLPMNGTFERKTITVPFHPDILRIGRQTNQKTLPTPHNGYFDSKVLSRQHAEIWADRDGKIWIRDIKSSNGTFVNGKRLSLENRDSEPHLLKEQDVLELGIDIVSENGKDIVHHKVAARVEHAGIYGQPSEPVDLGYGAHGSFDSNGNGQQMGPGFRNRPTSQGPMANGGRLGNGGPSSVAAYHTKWLQPVTMEQIVKKLNTELRQARLQSQDLHHTGNFVNAILSKDSSPPVAPLPPLHLTSQPSNTSSPSKSLDLKSRYSFDPPAPPPSQPLPEKPDSATRSKLPELPSLQLLLRRSDTEKPLSPVINGIQDDSPTRAENSIQINNLVEALTSAQREITSQSERLKEMESALKQEREARSSAEEKASRLSGVSPNEHTHATERFDAISKGGEGQATILDDQSPTSTLQERFDVMRTEMDNLRAQVEKFRQRAESAEQQSRQDQQTLISMVETIRKRDESARKRKEMRAHRAAASKQENHTSSAGGVPSLDGETSLADDGDFGDDYDEENMHEWNGHAEAILNRADTARPEDFALAKMNGSAWTRDGLKNMSAPQLDELMNAARAALSNLHNDGGQIGTAAQGGALTTRQQHLMQSAPYASVLGVVLLGVGVMAYLNGWQKVVER